MKTAIVIPARYGSTRFPGKPLAMLAGKSMLQHVYNNGLKAKEAVSGDCELIVATDDMRIKNHCDEYNMTCVITSDKCETGTDRVMEAVASLKQCPEFVVNLQGDAPFIYDKIISSVISDFIENPNIDIVTPVIALSWKSLDLLREFKKTTPFSGTTAILSKDRNCLWFSKKIIPAIRKEEIWRNKLNNSPIYRHLGLYGYRLESLEKYVSFEPSLYEQLEGLEQLRAIENGLKIRAVIIDEDNKPAMNGIDTPKDLERAEKLLARLS